MPDAGSVSDLPYLFSIHHQFIGAYQTMYATSVTYATAQTQSHFDIADLARFPKFTTDVLED